MYDLVGGCPKAYGGVLYIRVVYDLLLIVIIVVQDVALRGHSNDRL